MGLVVRLEDAHFSTIPAKSIQSEWMEVGGVLPLTLTPIADHWELALAHPFVSEAAG
jgi:hypothetical protein